MKQQIWKFQITNLEPTQVIKMPQQARILTVQVQNGVPTLWAVVDTDKPTVKRVIHQLMTGKTYTEGQLNYDYISSLQFPQVQMVFHYFDGGEEL